MKKVLVGVSLLAVAVALVGCGSGKQDTNSSSSHSKVSQVSHKKHKSVISRKVTATSDASSSHETTGSSTTGNLFAKQLTDNDWYVLAYLSEWHYTIADGNASPDFELSDGVIDQGTADSECNLISTTATTVTVAPSSGEGAWSTFHNVTLNKVDLIKQFVHSQDDVSLVAALSAKAVNAASATDDNDDDTNDDESNDDENTNDDDSNSDDESTDDQDNDSQDDQSSDDQETDTQDDDESTTDDSTADDEAWQVNPTTIEQSTTSTSNL